MQMSARSLDEILREFNSSQSVKPGLKEGTLVSVWLPREYKARYARLQELSKRRFSATLRELIMAAIESAENKSKA